MSKLIAIICAIVSSFVVSIFFSLLKEKQKQLDEELEALETLAKSGETYKNERHEMDKEIAKVGNSGAGNNFNNSVNFMQKLHEKGESRFK